ncbi:RWD domain-containing protein [Ditylenchus destructor]|nr:RWD domain-containing protein [Ditylenchus destructor]
MCSLPNEVFSVITNFLPNDDIIDLMFLSRNFNTLVTPRLKQIDEVYSKDAKRQSDEFWADLDGWELEFIEPVGAGVHEGIPIMSKEDIASLQDDELTLLKSKFTEDELVFDETCTRSREGNSSGASRNISFTLKLNVSPNLAINLDVAFPSFYPFDCRPIIYARCNQLGEKAFNHSLQLFLEMDAQPNQPVMMDLIAWINKFAKLFIQKSPIRKHFHKEFLLDQKVELHDFDTRGLGEAIRLLFAYTNTPYEDVRFTQDQWADRKSNYKFEPVLKVNGQELAQSAMVRQLRYLAEKFGLAGKDEWEKAKVHEVGDFHWDVYSDLAPYFYTLLGCRGGDKAALRKDVFLPNAERLFPQYVRLLKESGSGFLAPSGLTFVDFTVADYFDYWINKLEPEFMENYPEIVAFVEKVYLLPQIQDYMKKRKN